MHLTANEYRLVELLSRSAGKVLTYDRISEAMWGDAAGGSQINFSVRSHFTGFDDGYVHFAHEPVAHFLCHL